MYHTNVDVKNYNYIAIAFYSSNASLQSITTTPTATQLIINGNGLITVYDVQNINTITVDILGSNSGMIGVSYIIGF